MFSSYCNYKVCKYIFLKRISDKYCFTVLYVNNIFLNEMSDSSKTAVNVLCNSYVII